MILSCPDCATRYFLDDDKFGPGARTVRCAACGSAWKASREDQAIDLSVMAAAETATGQPDEAQAPTRTEEPLPRQFRAKVQARRETRKAAAAGVVWGGLGAAVLAVVLAAFLFRIDVVRLWPRTAGAYAKVGLPVNPVGLSPENIQASPGLKDGHVAVNVTGALRNVESRPRTPTALKISLLDKAGKPVASTVIEPEAQAVEPGKTAPFSASFLDPPSSAVNVQVEFVFGAARAAGHDRHAKQDPPLHAAAGLRGRAEPSLPPPPLAKAAEPLPAGSPYALPPAHEAEGAGRHEPHHG